jgi:hypothetical protein
MRKIEGQFDPVTAQNRILGPILLISFGVRIEPCCVTNATSPSLPSLVASLGRYSPFLLRVYESKTVSWYKRRSIYEPRVENQTVETNSGVVSTGQVSCVFGLSRITLSILNKYYAMMLDHGEDDAMTIEFRISVYRSVDKRPKP